jgi:hypothetical protein
MSAALSPESDLRMGDYQLDVNEPHPAALAAMAWLQKVPLPELFLWQEAFASSAIEGNRLAEICSTTLDRLLSGKPVSDRYLLGLAWTIRSDMDGK